MSKSRARGRTAYAAFLRGVNIGGHRTVGMQQLKKAFEDLGAEEVRTVLTSGNVLFRAPRQGGEALTALIERKLRDSFGVDITVMVRTVAHLQTLADADPFRGITLTPQTRFLVTFLRKKPKPAFRLPADSGGPDFRIVEATGGEILTVLTASPDGGTPEFMKFLQHEFGRGLTTRTWGTVLRMLRT